MSGNSEVFEAAERDPPSSAAPLYEPVTKSRRPLLLGAFAAATLVAGATLAGIIVHWSFGEWVGVGSLLVSVLGFAIAILEIHRARTVALATRQAVDGALRRVESARLQVAITEMQGLVSAIEDACDQNEMKSFRDSSRRWRALAGSAMALLVQRSTDNEGLVPRLEAAQQLGREANRAAHEEGKALREAASAFLEAIAVVSDELTFLAEDLMSTTGDSE